MIIGRKKFQYLKQPAGNVARTFPGLQQQIPRQSREIWCPWPGQMFLGLMDRTRFFLIRHIPAYALAFVRACACGKSGGFIERCCLSSHTTVQYGSLA